MTYYIIEIKIILNGEEQTRYHESISESDRTDTMNVYVEHITSDKKNAKRFYDREEATKVANLFMNASQKSFVVMMQK